MLTLWLSSIEGSQLFQFEPCKYKSQETSQVSHITSLACSLLYFSCPAHHLEYKMTSNYQMNDVFTIMNTIMNTFVHTAFSLIFLTSFQMYRKVISLKKSQISSLHFPNIKILLYLLPLFLFPFLCVSLPVFVYVVFF